VIDPAPEESPFHEFSPLVAGFSPVDDQSEMNAKEHKDIDNPGFALIE
jgi:hypothetical protein